MKIPRFLPRFIHSSVTRPLAFALLCLLLPRVTAAADAGPARELLIGSSLPLSGPFQFVGLESRRGLEICFAEINAAGGIHGRSLRLVAYDDHYEPGPCVFNTGRLLAEDRVFALCTYVGTPTAVEAMPVWQDRRVPVVGFYTGAAQLRVQASPFNIHVRASYNQEAAAIVNAFVQQTGRRKIAILYQNDAFGQAVKSGAEIALKALGLAPVAYGRFERNTLDIEAGLADIAPARPDAVIMVGTYAPLAKFVRAAKSAGLADTLFHTVSFAGAEAYAAALGGAGANCFMTQVVPPPDQRDTPAVHDYLDALATHAPGSAPSFAGIEAYLNARLLAEGLRRAGPDPTPAGLIAAIETITDGQAVVGFPLTYGPKNYEGGSQVFITHCAAGVWRTVRNWAPYVATRDQRTEDNALAAAPPSTKMASARPGK